MALLARRHFRKSASVREPGRFGLPHFSTHNPPPCDTFAKENGNNYDRKQQGKEHHQLPCLSPPVNIWLLVLISFGAENKQFCLSSVRRKRSQRTAIPFSFAAEMMREENGTYVFLFITMFYF